ncbi:MAG: chromosomal replication initiator protein DnaA [Polyangiales bacterium]
MQDVWNGAIAELRTKMPTTFDRWFSSVQFDGLTDGVLQLRAQNAFVRDFVTTHYLPVLKEKIRERTGLAIDVAWAIDADLSSPVAEKPLDRQSVPPPPPSSSGEERISIVTPPVAPQPVAGLNPKYLFANFVVGASNELAHAAALAAAGAGSVRRYNPLFICGGTGLGKTHLLHAIGHHVHASRPGAKIVVVSAEAFTNEFISAIANKEMDAFRTRYRTQCDLLLMDDVHNLAGREQTQEEFFHTFNALHSADKQIVLTSDRYPHELERTTERLVSRFTWGLVADVQVPQLETRVAIVRKKAQLEQLEIDDEVAVLLAQAIRSNVRELEGALIRLAAQASILGRRIDLEFARSVLASTLPSRQQQVSVEDVVRAVCHHFNLRSSDLLGKDRHRSVAQARHVAIYLCRQRLKCSYPELGRHFGHRDHTSVMHAVKKVEALRATDAEIRGHIDAIERKLGA